MADELLPPSLANDPRSQVYADLAARLSSLDLSVLLVYLVDIVDVSALPALAWQFHVDYWDAAGLESRRREVIRQSIEIHRHKGTPYGVLRALETIGYRDAALIEAWQVNRRYDGSYCYDGAIQYDSDLNMSWAEFDVILNAASSIDEDEIHRIRQIIQDAAPARSHLRHLYFTDFRYDGAHCYDGANCYDGGIVWQT